MVADGPHDFNRPERALILHQGIIPAVGGIAFGRSSRTQHGIYDAALPPGTGIFDLHLTHGNQEFRQTTQ
jgi:hypothetical protein